MQFVTVELETKPMMSVIRTIPEKWWKEIINDLSSLFGFLHTGTSDTLARYATEISISIGRIWIREQRQKAGLQADVQLLLNCTVSEERIVTINIPLFTGDGFYQLRISPIGEGGPGKKFKMCFFYPSDGKSVIWYGRLAAHMTYDMGMGESQVCIDGEWISIKAWCVVCAMLTAQGVTCGGDAGVIMDMARDGVI